MRIRGNVRSMKLSSVSYRVEHRCRVVATTVSKYSSLRRLRTYGTMRVEMIKATSQVRLDAKTKREDYSHVS